MKKRRRKVSRDSGCIATPGNAAGRAIDRAWAEGRVIPVNAAARRNYEKVTGQPAPPLPDWLEGLLD
jgi:hypothetical protein